MKTGPVGGQLVTSSNLGHHQQCYSIALAACLALGVKFDETSPTDILDKIHRLVAVAEFGYSINE